MPGKKNIYYYTFSLAQKMLKGRFNLHTPFIRISLFNNFNLISDKLILKGLKYPAIELDKKLKFKFSQYRVPQTKTQIAFYNSENLKATLIATEMLFIYSIRSEVSLSLKVSSSVNLIKGSFPARSIDKNTLIESDSKDIIISNFSFSSYTDIRNILFKEINAEKERNIAKNIVSQDSTFLRMIDDSWSQIDCIDPNGSLIKSGNLVLDNLRNALLNEISELLNFGFNKKTKISDSGSALQLWNKWIDKKAIFEPERLQSIWNKLSFPVQEISFYILFYKYPLEIIALFLWSNFHNYFWRKQVAEKIIEIFSDFDKNCELLFKILIELLERFPVFNFSDSFILRSSSIDGLHSIRTNQKMIFCRKFERNIYNGFSINSLPQIKIDKSVKIVVSDNNKFSINPSYNHITYYKCSKCIIEINQFRLKISLVWRQFTVWFGEYRFKFLFKKNRYLVSIKGPSNDKTININGIDINLNKRYAKHYLSVDKIESEATVERFDNSGFLYDKEKETALINKDLLFYSAATDRYGLIPANILLKKNTSQKQTHIVRDYKSIPYCIAHNVENNQLIFPKITKNMHHFRLEDKLFSKFMNTSSREFITRVGIFSDLKLKASVSQVLSKYWNSGYDVLAIDEIDNYSFEVNIYISNDTADAGNLYNIKVLKKYASRKILLFSFDNFNKLLDLYFINISEL